MYSTGIISRGKEYFCRSYFCVLLQNLRFGWNLPGQFIYLSFPSLYVISSIWCQSSNNSEYYEASCPNTLTCFSTIVYTIWQCSMTFDWKWFVRWIFGKNSTRNTTGVPWRECFAKLITNRCLFVTYERIRFVIQAFRWHFVDKQRDRLTNRSVVEINCTRTCIKIKPLHRFVRSVGVSAVFDHATPALIASQNFLFTLIWLYLFCFQCTVCRQEIIAFFVLLLLLSHRVIEIIIIEYCIIYIVLSTKRTRTVLTRHNGEIENSFGNINSLQ